MTETAEMTFNPKLVQRGKQNPTRALLAQSDTALKHGTTYQSQLIAAGLEPTWFDKVRSTQATVAAARGTQYEVRSQALNSTINEAAARDDGKRVLRKVRTAAQLVLCDGPVAGVSIDDFMTGKVGKSSAGVLDHLNKLRPHVATLEEQLKRYFSGESPLAQLDQVATNLREASGTQAALQDSAPLETLALYQAQGELLALIEHVNLVARLAFDGKAALLALFNKDILLNARRSSRQNAAGQKPDQPQAVPPAPA